MKSIVCIKWWKLGWSLLRVLKFALYEVIYRHIEPQITSYQHGFMKLRSWLSTVWHHRAVCSALDFFSVWHTTKTKGSENGKKYTFFLKIVFPIASNTNIFLTVWKYWDRSSPWETNYETIFQYMIRWIEYFTFYPESVPIAWRIRLFGDIGRWYSVEYQHIVSMEIEYQHDRSFPLLFSSTFFNSVSYYVPYCFIVVGLRLN